MIIGIAVAILVTGDVQADAKLFKDVATCQQESAPMVKSAVGDPEILAYKIECYDAETFLVIKKSAAPVKPKASKEPGPDTQGS